VPSGAKSRMCRTETPGPIWIKFCMVVDITDVVTHTNFGDHRLRVFGAAGGQISPFPIDFRTTVWACDHICAMLTGWSDVHTHYSASHGMGRPSAFSPSCLSISCNRLSVRASDLYQGWNRLVLWREFHNVKLLQQKWRRDAINSRFKFFGQFFL